jgi:hypothetical protein
MFQVYEHKALRKPNPRSLLLTTMCIGYVEFNAKANNTALTIPQNSSVFNTFPRRCKQCDIPFHRIATYCPDIILTVKFYFNGTCIPAHLRERL